MKNNSNQLERRTKHFFLKPIKLLILSCILFMTIAPLATSAATITVASSGLWNSSATWPGGNLPTVNDDVIVPSGIDLIMVGVCRAKTITVNGTLSAVNWQPGGAWINLDTEGITVENGGRMEIGTEAQPYHATEKCLITLKGNKISSPPGSYKGIMVKNGGTLELHGKVRKSWTNIATTANAGATQITLLEAVDWEVGDNIALTSTDLAVSNSGAWENVDEVTISAISGDNKTLTLTQPLQYKHIGGSKTYTRSTDGKTWNADIYGEVGLLSHYITIQGDMSGTNEQDGFGGHIMCMKGSTAHVEHVELYKMGQKGVMGRYPFHWHLNEDQAQGSYLRNTSIHKSFNRAVTIHGTDYVTVDGVFAYDHIGHGIFFEDGGERFNTIKNNVVFVTRRPSAADALTPSDNEANSPQNRTPASYWITNPNNYFENNVAAGTEGTGFWFAFPESPMEPSGSLPYFSGMNPTTQPLGSFDGFVAHTCMNGWDIFDQLNPDHSLKTNFGWNINSPQLIRNGLFYSNDQAIYCGLGNAQNFYTTYDNCVFSDNKTVSMLAGDLTIQNSLFNVDTDLGVFDGTREFFRFYDGPGRHINCHFEGWNRTNSEMIKQITGGGATENFNPTFSGTTKGFSEPFPFRFYPLPNTSDTRTRKIGQFFKDYDGGLTGKANTTLIRDIPFLTDGHEYRHSSWRNAARSDYFFAGLWLTSIQAGLEMSVTRTKPGTPDACFWESGVPASGTYKFPLIVNEDFLYTYRLSQVPSGNSMLLIWNRGEPGDLVLTCFKGLGNLGNFRAVGHQFTLPELTSKTAVENATDNAYFVDGNGDVYVKFRNLGGDNRVNIFFNWDNNGTFVAPALSCTTNDLEGVTALDSDGDGRPDIYESENCGLVNNASDLSFEFNQSDEGFQQVNISASNTSSQEYWLLRADNQNDPYIVRNGLGFSGNQVPQLKVRARSEAAGAFQVFWATINDPGFSAARSVTVSPAQTNVFEELVFDMSGFTTWMGQTITEIRLDFPADASANIHTFVDYILGPDGNELFCNQCSLPWSDADFNVSGTTVNYSSGAIDISCASAVTLSLDIAGVIGSMETNQDYLTVSYSVDGGSPVTIADKNGNFNAETLNVPGISGSSLVLSIDGYTSVASEVYEVSNISVVEEVCNDDLPWSDADFNISATTVNYNSGAIDISCASNATLSLDIAGVIGSMETNQDYLTVSYSVDGGSPVTIANKQGNFNAETLSVTGISGSTLVLYIDGYTSVASEVYEISNISVVEGGAGARHSSVSKTIAEKEVSDNIVLYPNPAKDILNVRFNNDEMKNVEATIFDLSGRRVHYQNLNDSQLINIKSLKSGTYLLKLVHGDKAHVERFIKK